MALTATELTLGLQTRLSSTLPLNARCRLAANTFTCQVAILNKDEVVLNWLLTSLDQKYRDRLNQTSTADDSLLWETLQACLNHMHLHPISQFKFCTVPDILLNILPHIDLSLNCISSCVSSLLTLASSKSPDHPNWSPVLSMLISLINDQIGSLPISSLHTALQNVTLDPTQDHASLITHLSKLHLTHPHPSLQHVVRTLLFSSPDPYTTLFSHLAGVEGKYHPGYVSSNLLRCFSEPCSPLLLMSSCPDKPDWLRSKLFCLLVSTQGWTGLVDQNSVEGGKLSLAVGSSSHEVHKMFSLALPLDLSVEVRSGFTVGKNLQEVVREVVAAVGLNEVTTEIIEAVHRHHPQLLDSVVGLVLEKYLANVDASCEVFQMLVDVMLKLRQLPKMVSKIFLQLRSSSSNGNLSWSDLDMAHFGSVLATLPRVQILEMWKTLNYHFTSDVLNSESVGQGSDNFASILSPLLSTVLLQSQLSDHNLPSSLIPRIDELIETTLASLEKVLALETKSSAQKKLLVEVTFGLSELTKLFDYYRGIKQFQEVQSLRNKLADLVVESPDWQICSAAKKLVFSNFRDGRHSERYLQALDDILLQADLSSDIINTIPNPLLVKMVKKSPSINVALYENTRVLSAIIFAVMEKMNRQENYFIPEFERWNDSEVAALDSYLAKSLASCFTTLLHLEIPASDLSKEDLDLLGSLPLENLPVVLKLGATLVCLSQIFNHTEINKSWIELSARCLETTDIFRFVDTGSFLKKILNVDDCGGGNQNLIEVVAKSAGRFTKTIMDIDRSFQLFEDEVDHENNMQLKALICLLDSIAKSLNEGNVGPDKKTAGKSLADKISKHIVKIFKKGNMENEEQIDLFCLASAQILRIYSREGLGKLGRMVQKMLEQASNKYPAWKYLLEEVCNNLDFLDGDLLPVDWKLTAWKTLTEGFDVGSRSLVQSLLKSASPSDVEAMFQTLLQTDLDLELLECIIDSEVVESSLQAKKTGIEEAVKKVCKHARTDNYTQQTKLPGFLNSIFSCSPPCITTQLEIVCLGTLFTIPLELAPASLNSLSSFLSHRGTLSTRTIPITCLLIRHFISKPPSTPTLLSLQKVLGLFSRHKADYASILPYMLADLLHLLTTVHVQDRNVITTSLYPLLDLLEKHSFDYLASSLPPATNEIFKTVLEHYNNHHKFKGKI